jgi:hypothetical protein
VEGKESMMDHIEISLEWVDQVGKFYF